MESFGPPFQIRWQQDASADVRKSDRATAMRIFEGVLRYARSGAGDIKSLQADLGGTWRLRIGDYRILFVLDQNVMSIFAVRHRSEAYR